LIHALSIAFALVAAGCIVVAIAMVVRGDDDRWGYVVRIAAVVCFAIAVVLNVLR
jgi:hypothetical protein